MNKRCVSKIALFITIMILLGNTVAIYKDYQDGWILEGLEIPFVLFVLTYAAAFFSETRTSWMVALAVVGRTVFLLIPNLKYVWFQGTYYDQHIQYALANNVYNEGHLSTQISSIYTATPLMHLSFSIFSIVLNVPLVDSMKYVPVLFATIYPLLTYVIVKRMQFSQGNKILNYALFISSIPFSLEQYVVTGSLLGILLAFLILSNLIMIFKKNDRCYWLVCTILIFALAIAHSVTSVILSVSLLSIMVLQKVPSLRPKPYLRASIVLVVTSVSAAWLMFPASRALEEIVRQIFVAVPSGTTPESEYISSIFFEHLRVNVLSATRSFLVYYGADAFFLFLTIGCLILLLKKRKQLNSVENFIFLFGWLAFLLIIVGYLLKLGAPRSLLFLELLFPVFSSILIFHISRNSKAKSYLGPVILSSIIVLATIQLYGCQPLIPSANVLYKGMPPEVPMSYVNIVNSVYQRQMISFAEAHLKGTIAAVSPTANQIIGLAGSDFWSVASLVRYSPLDKNQPERRYDYFLIHLPGKSGTPSVKPQLRPSILEAIYNSSVVYTNGESFILEPNYPKA